MNQCTASLQTPQIPPIPTFIFSWQFTPPPHHTPIMLLTKAGVAVKGIYDPNSIDPHLWSQHFTGWALLNPAVYPEPTNADECMDLYNRFRNPNQH